MAITDRLKVAKPSSGERVRFACCPLKSNTYAIVGRNTTYNLLLICYEPSRYLKDNE